MCWVSDLYSVFCWDIYCFVLMHDVRHIIWIPGTMFYDVMFCADFWDIQHVYYVLCWDIYSVFWRVLTFLCMESQASVISRFVVFPRTSCPYWVWRVYSNLLLMSSVIWRSHKNIIDQIPQIISYTAFSYFTERNSDIWNQAPQIISYTAFFFYIIKKPHWILYTGIFFL